MKIKRAPLMGAIGIILIIGLLINTCVFITHLKKENATLIENNDSLNTTINNQSITIETLKKEKVELEETILNLEQKLTTHNINHTPREDQNITSRSQETRGTLDDREMLARLVFLEANTESLECQKAIASVIINRLNSGYWGHTIESVIYARGQFTPASKIPYTTPTNINYEAVDYVLSNGPTLPSYVLYFRSSYHFSWQGYVPYSAMGNTYFGYLEKDVK